MVILQHACAYLRSIRLRCGDLRAGEAIHNTAAATLTSAAIADATSCFVTMLEAATSARMQQLSNAGSPKLEPSQVTNQSYWHNIRQQRPNYGQEIPATAELYLVIATM